jgi:hypothetical protein
LSLLSAAASLVTGIAILTAIFFFTYAVVWFGYNYGISAISELIVGRGQRISRTGILIVCWCFLALLFIENAFVSRDYWTDYTVSRTRWSFLWLAGVVGSLVSLLGNASASARMITDILLTGPRLMVACGRALQRALLLKRADLQTLLSALKFLARKTSPVSVVDLSTSLQGKRSSEILSELVALDAVIHTRRDPPTIVLDPDLREQLQNMLFIDSMPDTEQSSEPKPVTTPSTDDALFELLGLSPSASLEEVKAAFRRKMKECHPDVFAGRSDDARRIAEEKTKNIIAAYEKLLALHHRKQEEEVVT